VDAQATKVISIRSTKQRIMIFFFFIAMTPLCKFDCEMVGCKTFSIEGVVRFDKIFLDLLTTSLPNTSPFLATVQIATIIFVPE
ncbi:MAG: hypothetical protein J5U19_15590, partial [Candidatus Methanoperedens sp.]|nr:hypothetical protein [Candidatus Methanoperedens sp.]